MRFLLAGVLLLLPALALAVMLAWFRPATHVEPILPPLSGAAPVPVDAPTHPEFALEQTPEIAGPEVILPAALPEPAEPGLPIHVMPQHWRDRLAAGGALTEFELGLLPAMEAEYEAQQAFEELVREESFDQSIYHILYEPDYREIRPRSQDAVFNNPARALREALAQPRVAKIMDLARNGTPVEKAALEKKIASALHEYLATTPLLYDHENAQQRSITAMVGAHLLAMALPLLESGTDHFHLVAYMHAMNQEGGHLSSPVGFEGYALSEPGFFFAYVENEYLRRIASDPAHMSSLSPTQAAVIEEYRALGLSYFTEDAMRLISEQAQFFDLATRFWADED